MPGGNSLTALLHSWMCCSWLCCCCCCNRCLLLKCWSSPLLLPSVPLQCCLHHSYGPSCRTAAAAAERDGQLA
jgi:hypothetical protein